MENWAFLTLLAIIALPLAIGLMWIQVINSAAPSLWQMFDAIEQKYAKELEPIQNDSKEVSTTFHSMHLATLYELQAQDCLPKMYRFSSSVLMAFDLINTLGDFRVNDQETVFYLIYSYIGTFIFLMVMALFCALFERKFFSLFSRNYMRATKSSSQYVKISEANEESFLRLLKKQQRKKNSGDGNVAFGGNKLEVFRNEAVIVLESVEPACAVLLFFMLYVAVGGLIWGIIFPTNDNNPLTPLINNYYYVATICKPDFFYNTEFSIWQTIFLLVNSFLGCMLVTVTFGTLGKVFQQYLHDIFEPIRMKWYYEKEFDYRFLTDPNFFEKEKMRDLNRD